MNKEKPEVSFWGIWKKNLIKFGVLTIIIIVGNLFIKWLSIY